MITAPKAQAAKGKTRSDSETLIQFAKTGAAPLRFFIGRKIPSLNGSDFGQWFSYYFLIKLFNLIKKTPPYGVVVFMILEKKIMKTRLIMNFILKTSILTN